MSRFDHGQRSTLVEWSRGGLVPFFSDLANASLAE
jgi:hypothetical protein